MLKAEGFVSDEVSEVEKKVKPVYCSSNCNKEANVKNAKWCAKCGMVVCHFPVTKTKKEHS